MIENFEDTTSELTGDEMKLLPVIINGFKAHTSEKPIKAPEIVGLMNNYLADKRINMKFNTVRLRKFANHIRSNSLLPLIATSKGYYVSHDKAEIQSQIKSLRQRAQSIINCADGMAVFIKS